ncbi:MAG TPA: cyclic nucleotide-binding/CBS domain-containing protein [Chromatiales bacterium]|nr:cyclic nucleotide-binding/CBS domain-containing protein [Chromatiales bacterium]
MEIEQLEILDFLSHVPPLDKLDQKTLDAITRALEITYVRRGSNILEIGGTNEWLYLIRSGAVEVYDRDGNLTGHFGEGDWMGYRSVLRGGEVGMRVTASEDSLLYMIPGDLFRSLIKEHADIAKFFSAQKPERLRHAIQDMRGTTSAALIATQARKLVHRTPLILDQRTTIQQAAQKMSEKTATSLLVMDKGKLVGIITDRAFCTKVAANRLDLDLPVERIMTPNPVTIPPDTPASEALLLMARRNIRHLPVVDGEKIIGMVTATDLIRYQSHNAIYLINEIYRAESIDALKVLSQQLPHTLVSLVRSSLTAYDIGHAISSVGEAITRRLLRMAEEQYGPPPLPYAWIVAGSLARNEQTVHSDQDNALILTDEYNPERHDAYFERLSRFVCDGLHDCGYIYCPGEVMASNPKWRQPIAVWRKYFNDWIDSPQPKALMYASIFFDLRTLHDEDGLLKTLYGEVLEKTQSNTIFQAYMAANALHYQPPLGLFRTFVLEKTGAEEKALNMKKRGVVPITDLARVYALACGIDALNTQDRLEAAADAGALSKSGMQDLRDAFEFISTARLQHQAAKIERGEPPDHFVPPERLSSLERRHLKDAFEVVRTMQEAMAVRYQTGRIA